jgi:DNA-directed RNA polymerase specialized sigma24 family protein
MMRALPPLERDVLVLRIVEGLSFAEIAAAVGISEEAAKKRSQRGLQRLRARVRRLEDPAIGPVVLSPKGSGRRREVGSRT